MEEFYSDWRRRLGIVAALLVFVSGLEGFAYFRSTRVDDPPCASSGAERWCDVSVTRICHAGDAPGTRCRCAADDPCVADTRTEQRWRSAHQQGLLHALLLFGFAGVLPFLRLGRPLLSLAGWSLIAGCLLAALGAGVQALTTNAQGPPVMCPAGPRTEIPAWECLGVTIGTFAGVITTLALGVTAAHGAWAVVRAGLAPDTWRNWARLVSARPRRLVEPRSPRELLAAVQGALDERMPVRAFGGRYSWSDVASCAGVMIDMRGLCAIGDPLPPDPADALAPPGSRVVTVEAGATIREITLRLAGHGLMLACTPVNPWIQAGGALALGCHGTGIHQPQLADQVTHLRIAQYDANRTAVFRDYRRPLQPPNPSNLDAWEEWNALKVNLGCLGVMVAIGFECVPIYDVRLLDTRRPMQATLASDAALHAIVVGNAFSEIFWFPFNESIFVRAWNPTAGPAQPRLPFRFWLRQWIVAKAIGPSAFAFLAVAPFLTPAASRLFDRWVGSLDARIPAPEAMQYERYFHRVFDMGYAIPIDPGAPGGWDAFRKAWFEVVDAVEAARHRAQYPQNLVMHVRFGRPSSAFLAPNGGAPVSAFLEIITHASTPDYAAHFAAIERGWRRLGGKSHWGKMTFDPAGVVQTFPGAASFRHVRRAMDPDEVFLNDYVRTLLHV